MYSYIDTSEDTKNRIYLDLIVFNYYEDLSNYTEEQIKAALDDVCDIYYGHNLSLEGIAEKVIEILTEE